MLRPDFKFANFEELEPRLQQMLFEALRTENKRLRAIEASWLHMKENCPRADFLFYQKPNETLSDIGLYDILDEDSDALSDTSTEKELYRVSDEKIQSLRKLWLPVSENPDLNRYWTSESYLYWDEASIAAESPGADLEMLWPRESYSSREYLEQRVSSQMLWYRLIKLFGQHELSICQAIYTHHWRTVLKSYDGTAMLRIGDICGYPYVTFEGTNKTSSAKAIELLSYVSGDS